MLKKIAFGLFSLLLVLGVFAAAGVADEKLFVIDDVDYDDPYAPGDVIPVEITLENLAVSNDVEDIVVRAWLEDDIGDRIVDKVRYDIKRMHQDDEKEFTVYVPIPADTLEDTYTLRVTAEAEWEETGEDVSDSWAGELEIEQPEHGLYVETVQLSTDHIIAGETLDVAVGVANNGQEDESNIKIKAEIPEIGAEKTIALLNTLGAGYDYTAYLTLDVPEADAGIYTFTAKVYNTNTGDVYEQDIVMETAEVVVDNGAAVSVPVTGLATQTIEAGKGSIFSIQVKNNENVVKTYDLVVGGAADWASTRVDPTQVNLGPGESEIVYVYVLPTDTGEHAFTMYVKEGGATIAANQVKVHVAGGVTDTETVSSLKNFFAFLVLVFILITAGYLYKKDQVGGKKSKQIYY